MEAATRQIEERKKQLSIVAPVSQVIENTKHLFTAMALYYLCVQKYS